MAKRPLSDFPKLLETIGIFLRDAEEKPLDMEKLKAARAALETIAAILYPREIQPYVCGRPSRLTATPITHELK